MKCLYCNRTPDKIPEYRQQAMVEEMSVEDYVRMDEGTYHKETDLFCCTDCYVKAENPSRNTLITFFRFYKGTGVIPINKSRAATRD